MLIYMTNFLEFADLAGFVAATGALKNVSTPPSAAIDGSGLHSLASQASFGFPHGVAVGGFVRASVDLTLPEVSTETANVAAGVGAAGSGGSNISPLGYVIRGNGSVSRRTLSLDSGSSEVSITTVALGSTHHLEVVMERVSASSARCSCYVNGAKVDEYTFAPNGGFTHVAFCGSAASSGATVKLRNLLFERAASVARRGPVDITYAPLVPGAPVALTIPSAGLQVDDVGVSGALDDLTSAIYAEAVVRAAAIDGQEPGVISVSINGSLRADIAAASAGRPSYARIPLSATDSQAQLRRTS